MSGAFTAKMSQTYDVMGFPVPKEEAVLFPPGWLETASPDERAAAGVYQLDDPPPAPKGKVLVSQKRERNEDGEPYWRTAGTKAPPAAPPSPPPMVAVSALLTLPDSTVVSAEVRLTPEQVASLGA